LKHPVPPKSIKGWIHEAGMTDKTMRIECADDVLALRVPPELSGYELVDGQLVAVSPVGPVHGWIAGELFGRLRDFVRERRIDGYVLIETGYVLGLPRDPERLRGPDVSFVRGERLRSSATPTQRKFFRFAPDLAVEIESEARPKDMRQRVREYLEAGTRVVWAIDAENASAAIYGERGSIRRLQVGDSIDGGSLLPGFSLPLIELFEL
jgi:Uma2 family endonuclease